MYTDEKLVDLSDMPEEFERILNFALSDKRAKYENNKMGSCAYRVRYLITSLDEFTKYDGYDLSLMIESVDEYYTLADSMGWYEDAKSSLELITYLTNKLEETQYE